MPIAIEHIHHVRLTVTDVDRALAFYTQILGFQVLRAVPGGVLLTQGAFLLGLGPAPDPAAAPADDRFSENRVGLDHLSFQVADRAALEAAVELFEGQGISHGEIKDLGGRLWVLAFRDPDNIQLELSAPA
jgi:glyoxylase I family protein